MESTREIKKRLKHNQRIDILREKVAAMRRGYDVPAWLRYCAQNRKHCYRPPHTFKDLS